MKHPAIPTSANPYEADADIEKHHWWFSVRRRLLKSMIRAAGTEKRRIAVDIGCGIGSNLRVLSEMGLNPVGLDLALENLRIATRKRQPLLVNGDLNNLPFRSDSIPIMIVMDVLEHLEDDSRGIHELNRCLVPGGMLVLTVPAFRFLWGVQDLVTQHKRRYTKDELVEKLKGANFVVLKCSYFNFFLFFPILVARCVIRLGRLPVRSENRLNVPGLNFLLKSIFSMEPFILKWFSFPFGVSILCLARKNEGGA